MSLRFERESTLKEFHLTKNDLQKKMDALDKRESQISKQEHQNERLRNEMEQTKTYLRTDVEHVASMKDEIQERRKVRVLFEHFCHPFQELEWERKHTEEEKTKAELHWNQELERIREQEEYSRTQIEKQKQEIEQMERQAKQVFLEDTEMKRGSVCSCLKKRERKQRIPKRVTKKQKGSCSFERNLWNKKKKNGSTWLLFLSVLS